MSLHTIYNLHVHPKIHRLHVSICTQQCSMYRRCGVPRVSHPKLSHPLQVFLIAIVYFILLSHPSGVKCSIHLGINQLPILIVHEKKSSTVQSLYVSINSYLLQMSKHSETGHDNPQHLPPQKEHWVVTSVVLLGQYHDSLSNVTYMYM